MCIILCTRNIPPKTGRALFSIRSASLDSISTSVSLKTLQSTSVPQHSPSMDTISKHTETNGKLTTKDAKGNTYILLETASTDCDSMSSMLAEEKRAGGPGGIEATGNSVEEKSGKLVNHGMETNESDAKSTYESDSLTNFLPTEFERCVPVAAEGVSTRTATEMAKQKDTKQPSMTNVSYSNLKVQVASLG